MDIPLSNFPPSFEGNPWTYGFALFSLTLVSALSIAQIYSYWYENRTRRELHRLMLDLPGRPTPRWTTLTVHRLILGGLYLTIILGALPDVLVLLFWGETSAATMTTLFAIDRAGDALTLVPFLASTALSAWAFQAIPQQLISEAQRQLKPFRWGLIRDKLKITALVLLIAAGVTLGKAGV